MPGAAGFFHQQYMYCQLGVGDSHPPKSCDSPGGEPGIRILRGRGKKIQLYISGKDSGRTKTSKKFMKDSEKNILIFKVVVGYSFKYVLLGFLGFTPGKK